jgi:methionyl aminopeptidase
MSSSRWSRPSVCPWCATSAATASAACFHDSPNVLHYGRRGEGATLKKPGMFFTVEPMVNLGKPHVKVLSDGWTAVTRDKSLSPSASTPRRHRRRRRTLQRQPAGLFRPKL